MYVIAVIGVLVCGVLGMVLFDSAFLGALIGLVLCFAGFFLFVFMPSKKEAQKAKSRKAEDNTGLQNQWDDKEWMKANDTEAYQNRRALRYFGDIIDNPGTPKSRKRIVALFFGLSILLAVIAVGFLFMPAEGMAAGSLLFLAVSTAFAITAVCMKKAFPKKYVLWLKAVNYNFIKECREKGIRSVSTKKDIARMKMVCEKIGMKGTDEELVRRFNSAVRECSERQNVLTDRSNIDRIDRIRERDEEEAEALSKCMTHTGRDKAVYMCRQKAQEFREKAELLSGELQSVYGKYEVASRSFSQQEHSWAIHGGAASAIAGPVAGVVVARDIQAKNEKIREHNQAVNAAVASVAVNEVTPILEKISAAKKEIEKWETRAAEAEEKLVEELPEAQLLEMLSPTVAGMTYNEAGTLRISVEVVGAKPVIYENVPASVDGFIRAVLKNGGEKIAEAILSLPYNGSARKQKLTGICLDAPEEHEIESIEFEPVKLWAIER